MDPIRSHSPLVRPEQLPVPVKSDARPVANPDRTAPQRFVIAPDDGANSTARRLLANPVDPMLTQGGEPALARRYAHANAEQSYRRTMSLEWSVHRTVDIET